MSDHQSEDEAGLSAWVAFASQFGSDKQLTPIIMEILFEELMRVQSDKTEFNSET